jgi:hypothetical protein
LDVYIGFPFITVRIQSEAGSEEESHQAGYHNVKNKPGGGNPARGDVVISTYMVRILFHYRYFAAQI